MIRKKATKTGWIVVLLALIASVLYLTPAYSSEIIDQSYKPDSFPSTQMVGISGNVGYTVVQTFVPEISGPLTAVGFFNAFETGPTGLGSLRADIVTVNEVGTPTSTSLRSGSVAGSVTNSWGKIDLSSPLNVTAGTVYGLQLSCSRCTNGSYYNLGYNRSGSYVNGSYWSRTTSSSNVVNHPIGDLGFITYMESASNNNDLSGLELSAGALVPGFASSETAYSVTVPYTQSSLAVKPTVADVNASVTVNGVTVASGSFSGNLPLNAGRNTISVVVTAEDRTTKTYVVTVLRQNPSSEARLSNLVPSSGTLAPSFSSNTLTYYITLPNDTTSIRLTPTVLNEFATVTVNGVSLRSGSASQQIPLIVGNNTVNTVVTAQDSTTTQTYVVYVFRSPLPITITTPAAGDISNLTLPTVSGSAYSGARINLALDGVDIQQVRAQADGSWSYTFTSPIAEGAHTITATDDDFEGNQASLDFTVDISGPSITYVQNPLPVSNWNNSNVTVTFLCSDALSRVAACPDPVVFTAEGEDQYVEVRATDVLGNVTTLKVSNISIDKTNPLIDSTVANAPNANGWYKESVLVNFSCTDRLSGINFCTPPVALTSEGADQPVSGFALDKAGNRATSTTQKINIDLTAPTISYAIDGVKNGAWYSSDVNITFTCEDALSGVAVCPAPVQLKDEGVTAAKDYEVFDRAGNRATVTIGDIRIDKSMPRINAVYPDANANGWYTNSFEIRFTCADDVSGVDVCPTPIQVTTSGQDLSFIRNVADVAGNKATATVSGLNLDTVAPTAPSLQSQSVGNQTVSLRWTAATDNFAVKAYDIFRDGNKLTTTTQLTYQDTNLISGRSYNYSVVAVDEAGNSATSNLLRVTTTSTNTATIYYRVPAAWKGTSFYHYTPIGGKWTSAPGLLMSRSTYSGFHVITIDLGRFTNMIGVFTSGTGLWDSNNSRNYAFPAGISTLDNGVVRAGLPGNLDTTAPSIPNNLASANTGNTSTSLTWRASTDNVNVTGYTILRNGVAIANSAATSYTDSGLTSGTTYNYTVLAYDAAGNKSAVSQAIVVNTTQTVNALTVYYKVPATWNGSSFFHYKAGDRAWSAAPGLRMTATNFSGYNVITVDLGSFRSAQAVFNNGASLWDNNGNKDYVLEAGVYTLNEGVMTTGTPQVDNVAPTVPANVKIDQVTTNSVSLNWTASTDNVAVKSYNVLRNGVAVGVTSATSYTDTGLLADTTYRYSVVAVDFSANQSSASLVVNGKTSKGNTTTIYYKVPSGSLSIIHYKPSNGIWTNVPTQMNKSEFEGYNVVTIDLGSSTSLLSAFNNGAGVWDNNDKKDYFFPSGTFTLNGSIISNGVPVVDTTAPTVPAGLIASNVQSAQLTISWTPSTDNVVVSQYEVYRNGVLIGTVSGTTFTDTKVNANTDYAYTVRAVDSSGNKSAISSSLSVKTATAGNTIKIYYKAAANGTSFIHYRTANGTWTSAPGVRMSASEFAGYNVITLNIGASTSITAVFNNGAGVWDNNLTRNYTFNTGVFSVTNNAIKVGTP